MDLPVLARYPFLREASGYIRAEGISLEELLTDPAYARARALGRGRVLEALERGAPPERGPVAEGDRLGPPPGPPGPPGPRVAAELGVDLRRADGAFRLHFADFLRHTSTMRETPWKLINQRLDAGYVRLRREKAVRVLRNAVQRRIEEGLPIPVNDAILEAFRGDLAEIRGILDAKKAAFKADDIGKVSITRFPPCMYNLLAQIQAHENVPHMGRFAIVSFLHHIGMGNEDIFRVFGDVPDFAVDVTKYQIDHITGTTSPTEYTPPECSTMKSYGLCPGPDRICLTIKHPLSYYRIKGRERRPRGESAATAA